MILHLLKRLILILIGYALATLFSGIGVGLIFSLAEKSRSDEIAGIIAIVTMMIGIYAAAPALITVIVHEALGLRRRLFYVIAACLIGVVLPVIVGLDRWYILVGLGLGPFAGLIYWVTAGRWASWRPRVPA